MSTVEHAVDRVAAALAWLDKQPVFIGGATIGLFLDPFAKAQMRPTIDVDCILPATTTYSSWQRIERQLQQRGWVPDPGGPICRYQTPAGDVVDLMAEDPRALGFGGRWYPASVAHAIPVTLVTGREVLVPAPEYALACKLEAFRDRGLADPIMSKDLEDIVALLDGCQALPEAVEVADAGLQIWLREQLAILVENEQLQDAMLAQLPRGGDEPARELRFMRLLKRLAS